ncbi:phage tail spike protein, partial [Clostridium saccharoperbutylacetonicum]|uniref:phage tail spike protein n=1 Tax=Clostridium saccharoperbutylacetonicum TaxID=36745 RepID=UPI0039E9A659
EGLNDDYIAELEYPLEDSKSISSNLNIDYILSIPTIDNRPDQLFRIIDKDTSLTTVTVQCQSKLLADLKVNAVRPATLTGLTRKQAVAQIFNSCLNPHSYTVGNLDSNNNTNVILNVSEGNPLTATIGDKISVSTEYGGEYRVDNNNLDIIDSRGADNGVVIEYGKNISSISEKINNIDLATVLIPKSGDYRLPEYQIVSPNAPAYSKLYSKIIELNLNIWDGKDTKKDDQITIDEAYTLMRQTCNKMFTVDKVDQMKFNYTVDFVQLSQTEEYKNYAILETVNLGDTVTIRHKKLNLDLQGRVNKISYTVNSEGITTIDKVEIGFARRTITDIIKDTVQQIKFARDEIMLSVSNSIDGVNAKLDIQANKISAVVESKDGGMSWQLSEHAFVVACVGASNSNVTIDSTGLIVNNGKIQVKNSSKKTVFYVNTSGKCNTVDGFVVNDGNSITKIGSTGIAMTNTDGYTSSIKVSSPNSSVTNNTTLVADDDFEVSKTLRVKGSFRTYGYVNFGNSHYSVDFDNDNINIGSKTLQEYIDARISAHS